MLPVRIQFFQDVSRILNNQFLVIFQTDKPMMPFLCDSLQKIVRHLMLIFISKEVVDKCKWAYQLCNIDLNDKKIFLTNESIKLPTATSSALRQLNVTSDVKYIFRKECSEILVSLLKKLLERSPLASKLCRAFACFSPLNMVQLRERCIAKFAVVVDMMYQANLLPSLTADEAKREYEIFLDTEVKRNLEVFSNYDVKKERLDTFFGNYLQGNKKYESLWPVCIFTFTFSHGQSHVERGFNINDDILVPNLSEDSLISQRLSYDSLKVSGQDAHNLIITDEMRRSCLTAGSRYNKALEESRKKKILTDNEKKKAEISNEICGLKRQIDEVKKTKQTLETEALQCYDETSLPDSDIHVLVAKGNGLRAAAREKDKLIASLEESMLKLNKEKEKL